jgi:hypothetical protein
MGKRQIIVDGEVKLVSYNEFMKNSGKGTTQPKPKAKKKIHVGSDQTNKDVKVDSPFNDGEPINIDQKPTKTEE